MLEIRNGPSAQRTYHPCQFARATKFCTVGPWYKTLFTSPLLAPRILRYLLEFWKISVPPGRVVLLFEFSAEERICIFSKNSARFRSQLSLQFNWYQGVVPGLKRPEHSSLSISDVYNYSSLCLPEIHGYYS